MNLNGTQDYQASLFYDNRYPLQYENKKFNNKQIVGGELDELRVEHNYRIEDNIESGGGIYVNEDNTEKNIINHIQQAIF